MSQLQQPIKLQTEQQDYQFYTNHHNPTQQSSNSNIHNLTDLFKESADQFILQSENNHIPNPSVQEKNTAPFNQDESETNIIKQLHINPQTLEEIKITQTHTLEVYNRLNKNQLLLQQIDLEDYEALSNYFETQYQQLSNLINMNQIMEKKFLRLKRYKSSIYFGEIINNQRQSLGILIQFTEPLTIYEGSWQNNLRQGRGFQIFQNGNIYNGFYLNGKPDGFGTYKWIHGDTYMGQWQNGAKNGLGLWKGAKGDDYLGEWKDDLADGYGVHKWINGDRYEGQFSKSLKHGKGKETFSNGDSYCGDYQNGKPCGFGEYTWATGSIYKGQFSNGLRNGFGWWKKETNDVYEGEWQNDRRCGNGTYIYSNGMVYKGTFLNNLKHGRGLMKMLDRSEVEGIWEKGQLVTILNEIDPNYQQQQQQTNITNINEVQKWSSNQSREISPNEMNEMQKFRTKGNFYLFNTTNRSTKKEQSNLKSTFSLIKEVNEYDTLKKSFDQQQDLNKTARKVIVFRLPKMNPQQNVQKKKISPYNGPHTLQLRKPRYNYDEMDYKIENQKQPVRYQQQIKQHSLDLKDDSSNYFIKTISPRSQTLQKRQIQSIQSRKPPQSKLKYLNLPFHDIF